MMQTLSKTELSWIIKAMEREAERHNAMMVECGRNSPLYNLAKLGYDNMVSVIDKLEAALNGGSKRIKIDR